ncbi:glycosyltransferase family 2 protein [Patescibacteria group bacterium]|nr:glycosyltransferase family 2 protein [Patescibacteria group bacterium]
MNKIKISLTIPTFNRADLLDQTLQSVIAQTTRPHQVIVIDNASTDDTPQVVKKYKEYGIKYHRNKTNLGMVGNYNQCIKLATGTHISFLHSDDLIAPTWHQVWLKTIKNNPADFYHCSICIIDINNKPKIIYHTFPKNTYLPPSQTISQLVKHHCPIIAPTGATVFELKNLKSVGPFVEKYKTEADVDIFLKIAKKSSLYYQKSVLFFHRSHPEQTFETKKAVKTVANRTEKLERYFKLIKHFTNNEDFILENIFMSLASTNLYLAKLEFNRVFAANQVAKKVFPQLWTKPNHYYQFAKIQLMFVLRAIKMQLSPIFLPPNHTLCLPPHQSPVS